MKRLIPPLFALLLWPALLWAQPPVEVKAEARWPLELTLPAGVAKADAWDCASDGVALFDLAGGRSLFFAKSNGRYLVSAWACVDGKATRVARYLVIVGDAPPVPPGPVPPGPKPPDPPNPDNPAPIPVAGLRVLIVYETSELAKLPRGQEEVIRGKAMRDYLNAKCTTGPDGKTKEWRFWDQNLALDGESQLWKDAMARKRASVPWLVVSNPLRGGGFEGPLPGTLAETMALIKKFEQ